MSSPNKALLDSALIISGMGLSTLFVSTDGNVQNPVMVAGIMLLVVFITGVVSFTLGRFVRDLALAIMATVVTTDALFVLYFVCRFFAQRVHRHEYEELTLLPIVFVVATAPAVVLSSVGFGRLASRFYQRKSAGFNHDA